MKKISLVLLVLVVIACKNEKNNKKNILVNYPQSKTVDTVDTYFGTQVKDPYRWLEDDRSQETAEWVKAQNKVTFGFLNQIPYRDSIKNRLKDIWNYEKESSPFKEGDYFYYYKNNGLQNQFVIYRKKEGETQEELFLDPNTFSKDGTTSLDLLKFSENGKLAAYSISEGGSDWRKVIFIDTETKAVVEDTLVDIKFGVLSWYKNEGLYYSSYDKPKGSELSAKTDQHKLYYHKLGTPQKEDRVVYGGKEEEKHRYIEGVVTQDNKYLTLTLATSTSGNKLLIKDLSKPNSPFITILDHTNSETTLIDNQGSKLYLLTNLKASNNKVVTVEASSPTPDHWVDFIPETENVLNITSGGGYFFAKYMVDAQSQIKQFDYNGKLIKEIELPGLGSVHGFKGKKEDQTIYYSFANYVTPKTIFAYDPNKQKSTLYRQSKVNFNPDKYETKQVFYASKDGTKIPMTISFKKGIALDGKNPTQLYGYGGFNISLTPNFYVENAIWMELGGIYAVANLRGGGEYGREWHDAGTQLNKQNVFDDFIFAANYLIKNQYTSSSHLAIHGGSNGGLLVGAVMTQQPRLAKVALPAVGVLDMLRYHTFTAGAGWYYDYGTADQSKEMFEYLKGYSPIHNVKENTQYPATLITTADHDDRVVPAHSFKFVATLQSNQTGTNPVLIRIETNAGHGAGTPVSKQIDQYADIFAFSLYNMGVVELP